MQTAILIDQKKAIQWGLNASESIVFNFITQSPMWATPVTIDGVVWWRFDVAKMPWYLPIIGTQKSTFQKLIQSLMKKWLIDRIVVGGRDAYFKVTDEGKKWNTTAIVEDVKISMESGKISTHRGKISTVKKNETAEIKQKSSVEKFPPAISIYNNINNILSKNNSNIDTSNSKHTEQEILNKKNKEKIRNLLIFYKEALKKYNITYQKKKKSENGKDLPESVAISNIIHNKEINEFMEKNDLKIEELVDFVISAGATDKYYATKVCSMWDFPYYWAEVFNKHVANAQDPKQNKPSKTQVF